MSTAALPEPYRKPPAVGEWFYYVDAFGEVRQYQMDVDSAEACKVFFRPGFLWKTSQDAYAFRSAVERWIA